MVWNELMNSDILYCICLILSIYTIYVPNIYSSCQSNKHYICIDVLKNCVIYCDTGIIFCMHPVNERRCYIVTSSLIGWAHA